MSDFNFDLPETLVQAALPALGGSVIPEVLGSLGSSLFQGAFNQSSARKQMRFQERMASTQYQRAAKDLEAAGLNRIIALGNPASAPAGAMATVQAPDFSAASAAGVKRGTAQFERRLLDAQESLADEQRVTQQKQQGLFDAQAGASSAQEAQSLAMATVAEQDARIKQVEADWSESTGIPVSSLNSLSGTAAGLLGSSAGAIFRKLFPKVIKK